MNQPTWPQTPAPPPQGRRRSVARWLAWPVALLLASCACPQGCFVVNGRVVKVSPEQLSALRQAWSPASAAVASSSRASREDIDWSLDFIANAERHAVTPCPSLDLKELLRRDLAPIKGRRPSGEPVSFTPKTYSEEWVVVACSAAHRWQVFDDANDAPNPHRVILAHPAFAATP